MVIAAIDLLARRTATLTRRTALGAMLGGVGAGHALDGEAKNRNKRRKRRKRKNQNQNKNTAVANAFGCLNVGDRCDDTDLQCCSGVCQKEPGGKGKSQQSFCVAHGEGSCRADQDACVNGDASANQYDVNGICFRTTGQAGFCGRGESGDCFTCRTDVECEALSGPGSACVVCSECEAAGGTGCVPPATGQLPG